MTIYVSDDNSEELQHKINRVFPIIEQWMNVNKLKMNAEKTKYMIVRDKKRNREVKLY